MPGTIPVILDTDIGTDIDDLWALAMLLGCPELDLKLLLTCCGDTTYRAHLAAKFLAVAGRSEIPVGMGVSDPCNEQYPLKFQAPWVEDFCPERYPGDIISSGIDWLVDYIRRAEEIVTIISIGATTNIARALVLEPSLAEKCRFVGMHGSIDLGYGGTPGAVPETNVRLDVPAFRQVLAACWHELLITPLDTCSSVVLDGEHYRKLFTSESTVVRAVLDNYRVFSKLVTWCDVDFFADRTTTLFDTVAVYLAYAQDLLEIEPIQVSVDDCGLMALDPGGWPVKAALNWRDLPGFYDHLVGRLLNA